MAEIIIALFCLGKSVGEPPIQRVVGSNYILNEMSANSFASLKINETRLRLTWHKAVLSPFEIQ